MVDIPVISSVTATAPVSAAASNLTAISVAIDSLSQSLQNLTQNIQTGATPTAMPSGNILTLQTALGQVTVTLPQMGDAAQQNMMQQLMNLVQSQRPLTLSLQSGSPPTQAVLLLPLNAATPLATTALTTQQLVPASPLPPLTAGATLSAQVLAAAMPTISPVLTNIPPISAPPLSPATNTAAENATPLSAQTNLPLSPPAPSATIPAPATQPPAATIQPATPQPAALQSAATEPPSLPASVPTPLAPTPTPAAPASIAPTAATLLQPGQSVSLQVDQIIQAAASPSSPAALPPLAANQVAATVVSAGSEGQMILKAGDATLFVKAPATATVGDTLIVTVEAGKPPPLFPLPTPGPAGFQNLPQLLAALSQIDPQALQQIMVSRTPQPNEALSGALMLLFNAFRQGDAQGWLGSGVNESLLRAGKIELVASLSRELAGAGAPAQDDVVGQWKSYPIPLFAEAQFQALTLYVHHDRDARQNKDETVSGASGGDKTRFLIDMRLSRLGEMQIDGFVQPKKLDMILRSETLLPPGMHNDLRLAYIKAVGAVGYAGSLNFQVGRQHWLVMRRTAAQAVM